VGVFTGCGAAAINLNVVFHGLFILHFTDKHVQVLTPTVCDHEYMVGNWNSSDMICMTPQPATNPYQLHGVDPQSMPKISNEHNLVLACGESDVQIHPEYSHYAMELPFPQSIRFLRCVDCGPNIITTTGDKQVACINRFSLCPTFIYSVRDYSELYLSGTTWKPKIEERTHSSNLHIWAEPRRRLTPDHEVAAYNLLSKLTDPVTIELGTQSSAPLDRYTGIPGLASEEEQGLAEWYGGGETSHPSNCNVVLVVPPSANADNPRETT
jgi:hypothetical protein